MIIRVIFGLLALGMGFDRHTLQSTNHEIFDRGDISKKLEVLPRLFIESRFLVPKTSEEVNKFLHIEPEFSLRSRHGDIKIDVYNDYISSVVDREKTLDILFSVYVEVETRTFDPALTQLKKSWQLKSQSDVGTHYVESILYGGRMLACYRLTPTKPEYAEDIKTAIAKHIGHRGDTDKLFPETIEKLEEEIGEKAYRSVQVYSTGKSLSAATNLKAVLELVKGFPKVVQETRKDSLAAVAVDVEDLHNMHENFTEFWMYPGIHKVLREVDERYEDLLIAQKQFREWDSKRKFYADEKEAEINDYIQRLKEARRAMDKAISNLNLMETPWQFDDALSAYEEGGDGSYKYRKEFKELLQSLKF